MKLKTLIIFFIIFINFTYSRCVEDLISYYVLQYNKKCRICFEKKEINSFITLQCGHKYCKDCLKKFFIVNIKEKNTHSLRCPDQYCRIKLDKNDVNFIINKDTNLLNIYNKIIYMENLKLRKNYRHCPTPDCDYAFIIDGITKKCPECSKSYCQDCLVSHSIFTRCQNDYFNILKLMQKKVKRCPACEEWIEKISGCDHMICKRCNYEFCWNCLLPNHKVTYFSVCNASSKFSINNRKCTICCNFCCFCCIAASKIIRSKYNNLAPMQEKME